MQMKGQTAIAPVTIAALAFVALFAISFVAVPLAMAASSESSYPIEIIRAHTVYITADPATPVVIGLGVKGDI